jgi:hypothetical protein
MSVFRGIFLFLGLRRCITKIWIIDRGMLSNFTDSRSSGSPCLPFLVSQVGYNTREKVEKFIRMLFLPVGKLINGSITD